MAKPDSAEPFSAKERLAFRGDTPAQAGAAYFAHGSVSLPPRAVFDAQVRWIQLEQGRGAQAALRELEGELTEVRAHVAALIGAESHQIALLDSASRAWAYAFWAALDAGFGRTVVTSAHEWSSNALNLLHARSRWRIDHLLRIANEGRPPIDALEDLLPNDAEPELLIVSLPLLPTAYGIPLDLAGVAAWVRARNGLLLVDASHAVGHLPVDVGTLGCDALVFPARKWLRGPKGLAVLYLSDRALSLLGAPSLLDIGGAHWQGPESYVVGEDARRFETWDHSPGLHLALKAACDYATQTGVARIAATNITLANRISEAIAGRCGVLPLESYAASAMLNYAVADETHDALAQHLATATLGASIVEPSYTPWWFGGHGCKAQLRLTPHYMTTDQEIEHLIETLASLPAGTLVSA